MSEVINMRGANRLSETMARPHRESVLVSASRLGDLIASACRSDAELRELYVHVGRMIATGSDAPGRGDSESMSETDAKRTEGRQGPLDEVYALILEMVHGRDALTLEQQLSALAVHLGALVASGYDTETERGRARHRIESRVSRACLATSRYLAAEGWA